ncbi:hypothetical protein [Maricaulis sp.]|uniref:hypothetical protein n=1 Tax=Maricaulis sp. TaxID=1486257 RepID=UPI0025B8C5B7|nr:hypothetical protein [Maricaulis sp.]
MRGLVLSLFVHAGIIAAGLIYLPRMSSMPESSPVVPIELVTLGETTNIRAARPDPEPVVEAEIPETTIEDDIAEPEQAPVAEPEPVAPEPEIIPAPVNDPEPEPEEQAPEPEPEAEPERPQPQPERRPDPRPEPREPSLNDMLGDLSRSVAETRDNQAADEGATRNAVGNGEEMTATLQVMLRSHLSRCWRASLDAPEPDELAVQLVLDLDRNGELTGPPRIIDQSRVLNSPNPYLRVAGERALRAAVQCQPYPLPPEAYSQWRQIEVNFSPSLYGG